MKENFFWAVLLAAAMLLANILIGSAVQPVQARQSAPAKTENLPEKSTGIQGRKSRRGTAGLFSVGHSGNTAGRDDSKGRRKQETQQNAQADPAGYESGEESEEAGSDVWENTADPEEGLGEDGRKYRRGKPRNKRALL